MGKEWSCTARVDGVSAAVKAHLDSEALRLSGSHRLVLPLADVRGATVHDDVLRIDARGRSIELELGSRRALDWQTAIVSPKTRLEKLGVRPGDRTCIKNIDDAEFVREIAARLGATPSRALRGTFDLIFVGVNTRDELDGIASAIDHLDPHGALWIVYPKGKGSPVPEAAVRAAFLERQMYDAKVVSFSTELTAIKAMVRAAGRSTR